MGFREGITTRYDSLFGDGDEETSEDFSMEGQFARKWGWYQSIYTIAQGRLERFDAVTRLSLHECLTYLSFEKDKNRVEVAQINKANK